MLGIQVRVQQTHGDGLDRRVELGERTHIERHELGARRVESFRDFIPPFSRHERIGPVDGLVVQRRTVLASDLDDVSEPLSSEQRYVRPTTLEQRVGGHCGAMGQHVWLIVGQRSDAGSNRGAGIVTRRRDLADASVLGHEIGVGTPRIARDPHDRKLPRVGGRRFECPDVFFAEMVDERSIELAQGRLALVPHEHGFVRVSRKPRVRARQRRARFRFGLRRFALQRDDVERGFG